MPWLTACVRPSCLLAGVGQVSAERGSGQTGPDGGSAERLGRQSLQSKGFAAERSAGTFHKIDDMLRGGCLLSKLVHILFCWLAVGNLRHERSRPWQVCCFYSPVLASIPTTTTMTAALPDHRCHQGTQLASVILSKVLISTPNPNSPEYP